MKSKSRPESTAQPTKLWPKTWALVVLSGAFLASLLYLGINMLGNPVPVTQRVTETTGLTLPEELTTMSAPSERHREATDAPAELSPQPAGVGVIHVFVTDRDGLPIANVAVDLALHSASNSDGSEYLKHSITDAAGEARFPQLPWGRYRLGAVHEELAGWARAALDLDRPISYEEIVLKPSGMIEGAVTNERGQAIQGAEVSALDEFHGATPVAIVRSGDGGTFAFNSLPLGRYRLQTAATGYAHHFSEVLPTDGPPVAIVLGEGGTLSGTVRHASNQAPVGGVKLRLVTDDFTGVKFAAASDARGEFLLERAPAGRLLISCEDTEYALNPPEVSVDLKSGGITSVDIFVEVAASISGTVYNVETGEALAGAVVRVSDPTYRTRTWSSAPSDIEGRYHLAGLTPGPLEVRLARIPPPFSPRVQVEKLEVELLSGEARDDLDFEVPGGLMVCGTVVDELQRPVAGAEVSLGKSSPRGGDPYEFLNSTSAAPGEFCIAGIQVRTVEVAPGQFEPEQFSLEANLRGMRSETIPLPDLSENLTDVRITLLRRASASIAGWVVDGQGIPAMASMSLRQPYATSGFDGRLLRTDIDGHFLFQDLAAGDYEIWMAADNGSGVNSGKQVAHTLALADGQRVTDLRLELIGAGFITGTLLDEERRPLHGVMIEAWKLGAEDLSSATLTDRQGRFRIAVQGDEPFELRPGSSAPGGFWTVQATPGADVEIVLTPNLLQGTQPEAAVYILDPETGEERVFRPEELQSEQ